MPRKLPLRALGRRPEIKTAPEPRSVSSSSWSSSGGGAAPWPALARMNNAAAAGNLADNPVVSIGLTWIRKNVIQGRIVVGSEDGGDYRESIEHSLTAMLRRPNPFDSWRATLGGTSDSLKVDGNAYWIKGRDGLGQVAEIHWAPNCLIEVVQEADPDRASSVGPIRGYWFTSFNRRKWYGPSDVVHFRDGRDPLRRWMGLSDLKRQLRSAASISAAERYTTAVLLNAHAGKIVMPRDPSDFSVGTLEDAELNKVATVLESGLSGEAAGRIHRSNIPVDLIDAGFGPEAMGLDRITDRPESYLLAALGLNALVLGLPSSKDTATYANKGEARREAWENGVVPVQDLIAEEIQTYLLPDFDDDASDSVWWDRRDVPALREDENERANRAVALYDGGLADRNEGRAMVDLPPVPDGDAPKPAPTTIPTLDASGTTTADPADKGDDDEAEGVES